MRTNQTSLELPPPVYSNGPSTAPEVYHEMPSQPQTTYTHPAQGQATETYIPQQHDSEMNKSQPPSEPQIAKETYYNDPGQQQAQAQPNMVYPSNGEYQTAIPLANLDRAPAPVDCPKCGTRGLTDCTSESGGFTNMLALVLCCCFCLGCLPYCINGTKDVNHKCSSCHALLAVWHRSNSKVVVIAHK
jgi:lipopolysaccharide-induced tumor necrosis factor-alpha factor